MLHEGHRASGSHDSVTDKIAQAFAAQTENPSADQTDGFGKQKYASIPLSPAQEQKIQRNKEEDERFSQSIQAYLRGDYGNETVFRVGTTPYCMRIVGAKAIPVVISQSVLFNSLASGKASKAHTEGHDIPPETLEKIPEAIRNPIFVCRGHRPDTLAVICDLTDKEQRNLLVAFALDVQGAHSKVNRITTVFGKKNIAQFVQKTIDSDGILAMNIKKAEKLSSHIGIQSPKSATILCFDDSIPYSDENVKKFSEISSQGTLTHELKTPITSECRATMLAAFAAKHNLEDLNVFVKKGKSYQSDGRAYDLIVKDGKSEVFSTLLFTLEPGEVFTESVLQTRRLLPAAQGSGRVLQRTGAAESVCSKSTLRTTACTACGGCKAAIHSECCSAAHHSVLHDLICKGQSADASTQPAEAIRMDKRCRTGCPAGTKPKNQ